MTNLDENMQDLCGSLETNARDTKNKNKLQTTLNGFSADVRNRLRVEAQQARAQERIETARKNHEFQTAEARREYDERMRIRDLKLAEKNR